MSSDYTALCSSLAALNSKMAMVNPGKISAAIFKALMFACFVAGMDDLLQVTFVTIGFNSITLAAARRVLYTEG